MKEFVFLSTLVPLISQVLTISNNGLYRGASNIGIGVCYPVGGGESYMPSDPPHPLPVEQETAPHRKCRRRTAGSSYGLVRKVKE